MKRILLLLACLLLLTTGALAADSVITDMKTDVQVDAAGSCQISQTVTISLDGIEEELVFPLGVDAKGGTLAGYAGKKYIEDGLSVLKLQSETGISGVRTFTVTYRLDDLITEEDGVQTLHLPLLSPRWDYPIQDYRFTVTLPKPCEGTLAFSSGYYGEAIEDYISLSKHETIVSGVLDEPLMDHESIDMTLSAESGYFSGHHARWSAGWVTVVIAILFAVLALLYWAKTLRDPRLRVSSRQLPPDSVLPGDVPTLLTSGRADFTMMVFHWATLGYLSIYAGKKGRVVLKKRMEMGNERRSLERKLFYTLFARGDMCDGASLQYKRAAVKADDALRRFWGRRLFTKNSGNPLLMQLLCCACAAVSALQSVSLLLPMMPARWLFVLLSLPVGALLSLAVQKMPAAVYLGKRALLVVGAFSALCMLLLAQPGGGAMVMVLALALSIFTGLVTVHGGRRSEIGTQLISQTLGFRRYLKKAEENHLRTMSHRDPQFFYWTLLYAEAMGFGGEYAGKFGEMELEPCDWYRESKPLPTTAAAFYARLRETIALLELSIRK